MKTLSQQLLELKEELDSVGTRLNGLTWQRIERHMKEFALEACKETLKNSRDGANTAIIKQRNMRYVYRDILNSIESENNIPKEVKL